MLIEIFDRWHSMFPLGHIVMPTIALAVWLQCVERMAGGREVLRPLRAPAIFGFICLWGTFWLVGLGVSLEHNTAVGAGLSFLLMIAPGI